VSRVPPWAVETISPETLDRLARAALEEDVGSRDATTEATVAPDAGAVGTFVAKQDLVVAGLDVAMHVFQAVSSRIGWAARAREGDRFKAGDLIASVSGPARGILTGERVALNFLQRMSGVATMTRRFVQAVEGTGAKIRDTRKTTPLLRGLEKRAVAGAGGLLVEVEVDTPGQIEEALSNGAQMILLDNFAPDAVRAAVARIGGRVPVEVSGGVRLENVRAYAEAGPDYIAIGALTHSAPAVDISLEVEPA